MASYQVEYKSEGMNFASPTLNEQQKDHYIEVLSNCGIEYRVLNRSDKKWHCAKVVFDTNLIPAARKAVKEKKDMDGLYTFGDPECLAKKDSLVQVECADGRVKIAYVVDIWLATEKEIKEFKAKIGYKRMGLVKRRI